MTQLFITRASAFGPLGNSLDDIWNGILGRQRAGAYIEVASGRSYLTAATRAGNTTNTHTYGRAYGEGLRRLIEDLEIDAPVDVLFLGTAVGNLANAEHKVYTASDLGAEDLDFAALRPFLDGSAAVGPETEIVVLPTGCCAGLQAAGLAKAVMERMGHVTGIVASLDMGLTPLAFEAFAKINATTERDDSPSEGPYSRPFCKDRTGFLFADGGGAMAVTTRPPAGPPVPRLTGYGCVSSAYHMTDIATDGDSIADSIRIALDDAGCDGSAIAHVNLHASGTQQNDTAEHNALHATLGDGPLPTITAFKGNHGHALAGANMLEIALTWKMMTIGTLPPTPRDLAVDAYDDVTARNVPEPLPRGPVLKTASGFSGIHASLVMEY